MKKILATFLAIAVIFTCLHSVFAQQSDDTIIDEEITTEFITDGGTAEEETTSPDNPEESEDNDEIVKMWICARIQGYVPTGHSWLYFENVSNQPVHIAAYELLPGEGVSVGSYCGFSNGFGVYYNIEAYKGNYDGICAKSTMLASQELETVNDKICNNNFWEFFFNCVFFATNVWNSVADTYSHYTFFPLLHMLDLVIWGAGNEGLEMERAEKDEIFRLREGDDGYYLEPCDALVIFQKLDPPEEETTLPEPTTETE